MKGIQGLIIAVGLGIAGAVANFYYLANEAQKVEMVRFIGVKPGVTIARGDKLTESNLVAVEIPKNLVGNLFEFACKYSEINDVLGRYVWRTLDCSDNGSVLLMRSDLKTPPKELELGKGERAIGIPVDARTFVTSLVNPGDKVSFKVPTLAPNGMGPTLAPKSGAAAVADLQPKPEEGDNAALPTGPTEIIGPFVVKSIGNRLGDTEVMKAAKIPQLQENVLMIRISKNEAGEEERFDKLWNRMQSVNFRNVGIILHGKE